MTLLDAPAFDEVRDRRRRVISWSAAGLLFVLFVGWWLVAGRPVDFPWNWNNHLRGRLVVNAFFRAVEKNDLSAAYAIWLHDKDWRQHQARLTACPLECFLREHPPAIQGTAAQYKAYGVWLNDKDWQKHEEAAMNYAFDRFEKDWSGASSDNDYGPIHSHRIAAARMMGNVLQLGIFVNGRKSKAINLDYDPKDHTLSFSPEGVQFLEGPGGIS